MADFRQWGCLALLCCGTTLMAGEGPSLSGEQAQISEYMLRTQSHQYAQLPKGMSPRDVQNKFQAYAREAYGLASPPPAGQGAQGVRNPYEPAQPQTDREAVRKISEDLQRVERFLQQPGQNGNLVEVMFTLQRAAAGSQLVQTSSVSAQTANLESRVNQARSKLTTVFQAQNGNGTAPAEGLSATVTK